MTNHEKINCIINDEMHLKQMTGLEKLANDFEIAKNQNKTDLIATICERIKDNKFNQSELMHIKNIVQNRMTEIADGGVL